METLGGFTVQEAEVETSSDACVEDDAGEKLSGRSGQRVLGIKTQLWQSHMLINGRVYSSPEGYASKKTSRREAARIALRQLAPELYSDMLQRQELARRQLTKIRSDVRDERRRRLLQGEVVLLQDIQEESERGASTKAGTGEADRPAVSHDDDEEEWGVVSDMEYLNYVRDSDIEEYLRGILWNIQMYVDGVCPDMAYSFSGRPAPTPFLIAHYISQHLAVPRGMEVLCEKICVPRDAAASLSAEATCVCVVPEEGLDFVPKHLQETWRVLHENFFCASRHNGSGGSSRRTLHETSYAELCTAVEEAWSHKGALRRSSGDVDGIHTKPTKSLSSKFSSSSRSKRKALRKIRSGMSPPSPSSSPYNEDKNENDDEDTVMEETTDGQEVRGEGNDRIGTSEQEQEQRWRQAQKREKGLAFSEEETFSWTVMAPRKELVLRYRSPHMKASHVSLPLSVPFRTPRRLPQGFRILRAATTITSPARPFRSVLEPSQEDGTTLARLQDIRGDTQSSAAHKWNKAAAVDEQRPRRKQPSKGRSWRSASAASSPSGASEAEESGKKKGEEREVKEKKETTTTTTTTKKKKPNRRFRRHKKKDGPFGESKRPRDKK